MEHPSIDGVSALLDVPGVRCRDLGVLLAHGSGAGMESEFLGFVASALCDLGFSVLRFQYPYMERRIRERTVLPPDQRNVLEDTHRRALAELRRRLSCRAVLAGKSLGGRIGSHVAAQGEEAAGLVFLGYPLHPPAKPESERSEHFAALAQPALFLQGTRDPFCELPRLRRALGTYGGVATLRVIEGADHSFSVLKRSGTSQRAVWDELVSHIDAWCRSALGG